MLRELSEKERIYKHLTEYGLPAGEDHVSMDMSLQQLRELEDRKFREILDRQHEQSRYLLSLPRDKVDLLDLDEYEVKKLPSSEKKIRSAISKKLRTIERTYKKRHMSNKSKSAKSNSKPKAKPKAKPKTKR